MSASPRDSIELVIDSIGLGGDGVGFDGDRSFFVPGTVPGERVRVRVPTTRGRSGQARLLEVLSASPDRTSPPCPHFGVCGGCQLQHLSASAQQQAKRTALAHATGQVVDPMVEAPAPYGYRARVRFHVTDAGAPRVGLQKAGTREVVPLDRCPVLAPALELALQELVAPLAALAGAGAEIGVDLGRAGRPVLLVRPRTEPGAALYARLEELVRAGTIEGAALEVPGVPMRARFGEPDPWTVAADGQPMRVATGSFAQANPGVTALLGRALLDGLALDPADRVLELHAGSGTLTVAIAPRVAEVVAVEAEREAVRALEENLRARGLTNVRVLQDDAAQHARRARGRFDVVLLDPPRTGATPELLQALAQRRPRVIGYVSCGPAALGRDLRLLETLGYVTGGTIAGFDMFPQTAHIEALALLRPRA